MQRSLRAAAAAAQAAAFPVAGGGCCKFAALDRLSAKGADWTKLLVSDVMLDAY